VHCLFIVTLKHIKSAHEAETETSGIAISSDRISVVTRGGDHTLKRKALFLPNINWIVWDTRMFSKPTAVALDLRNYYQETDVILSPDEKYIITGTSAQSAEDDGKIVVFDRFTLERKQEVIVEKTSVTRILWHEKTNQVST